MAKDKMTENKAEVELKDVAMVTYVPGDGDPHQVKWGGIIFKANVPTPVALTHGYTAPHAREHTTLDGTVQRRSVETKMSLVELARNNPSFKVDGVQAPKKVATDRVPQTNDQYRGYALSWIAGATDANAMRMRWAGEEKLRDDCGVDAKDVAWIMPFFEARVAIASGTEVAA